MPKLKPKPEGSSPVAWALVLSLFRAPLAYGWPTHCRPTNSFHSRGCHCTCKSSSSSSSCLPVCVCACGWLFWAQVTWNDTQGHRFVGVARCRVTCVPGPVPVHWPTEAANLAKMGLWIASKSQQHILEKDLSSSFSLSQSLKQFCRPLEHWISEYVNKSWLVPACFIVIPVCK